LLKIVYFSSWLLIRTSYAHFFVFSPSWFVGFSLRKEVGFEGASPLLPVKHADQGKNFHSWTAELRYLFYSSQFIGCENLVEVAKSGEPW